VTAPLPGPARKTRFGKRRTAVYFGEEMTFSELARRTGFDRTTLVMRWDLGKRDGALIAPLRQHRRRVKQVVKGIAEHRRPKPNQNETHAALSSWGRP
jgi:hypothetical protein